jgi:hypothetical protein
LIAGIFVVLVVIFPKVGGILAAWRMGGAKREGRARVLWGERARLRGVVVLCHLDSPK